MIFHLCLIVAGFLHSEASVVNPPCPDGQVYDDCYTSCPPSCDKLLNPKPTLCILNCVVGCRCADENPIPVMKKGNIVKCKTKDSCCPANQVWSECASSNCNPTCENPLVPCTADCVQRCVCPSNKPIWRDGKCISAKQCPMECYPESGPLANKCYCAKRRDCKGMEFKQCKKGKKMCSNKGKKWVCCCERMFWERSCSKP